MALVDIPWAQHAARQHVGTTDCSLARCHHRLIESSRSTAPSTPSPCRDLTRSNSLHFSSASTHRPTRTDGLSCSRSHAISTRPCGDGIFQAASQFPRRSRSNMDSTRALFSGMSMVFQNQPCSEFDHSSYFATFMRYSTHQQMPSRAKHPDDACASCVAIHRLSCGLRVACGPVNRIGGNTWSIPVERDRGYDHEECSLVAATIDIALTSAQPQFEMTAEMDAFTPPAPMANTHTTRPIDERLARAANQFVVGAYLTIANHASHINHRWIPVVC